MYSLHVAGWDRSQAGAASAAVKHVQAVAHRTIIRGTPEEKLDLYFKEKPVVGLLDKHGIYYIQRINEKDIIVDAGMPNIREESNHVVENRNNRLDRADMTMERAQQFVSLSKLTLYQHEKQTVKFLADEGYTVLSMDNRLVTAVPQKWRKKYDIKYICMPRFRCLF